MIAIVPCEFCSSTSGMDFDWKCATCKRERPGKPIPMLLHCPECRERHIDEGEFATKAHHTHACQSCGCVWRPALVSTVGVRFLPGFKNEPQASPLTVPPGVAPMPIVPWPPPVTVMTIGNERECALEAYFRTHPNETSVNLYCGCPKCSPSCSVSP